jgi:hypothetical protein
LRSSSPPLIILNHSNAPQSNSKPDGVTASTSTTTTTKTTTTDHSNVDLLAIDDLSPSKHETTNAMTAAKIFDRNELLLLNGHADVNSNVVSEATASQSTSSLPSTTLAHPALARLDILDDDDDIASMLAAARESIHAKRLSSSTSHNVNNGSSASPTTATTTTTTTTTSSSSSSSNNGTTNEQAQSSLSSSAQLLLLRSRARTGRSHSITTTDDVERLVVDHLSSSGALTDAPQLHAQSRSSSSSSSSLSSLTTTTTTTMHRHSIATDSPLNERLQIPRQHQQQVRFFFA